MTWLSTGGLIFADGFGKLRNASSPTSSSTLSPLGLSSILPAGSLMFEALPRFAAVVITNPQPRALDYTPSRLTWKLPGLCGTKSSNGVGASTFWGRVDDQCVFGLSSMLAIQGAAQVPTDLQNKQSVDQIPQSEDLACHL